MLGVLMYVGMWRVVVLSVSNHLHEGLSAFHRQILS
jgi:hypothetical protein